MSMNTNSYFTIEILTAGNVFIQKSAASAPDATFYYWINTTPNANRDNYDGSIAASTTAQYIKVDNANPTVGTIIRLYRAETTRLNESGEGDTGGSIRIRGTAGMKFSGNIASLIGFNETIPTYCFRYMFYQANVIDASELELPWTTLSEGCFIRLFMSCAALAKSPYLPATTIAKNCYTYMFRGTALTVPAKLGLQTVSIKDWCNEMYGVCTSLNKIKLQPFHFSGSNSRINGMFRNCTSLTEAEIETYDETLPNNAYQYLFRGCSNLTKIKCLSKSFNSNTWADWLLDASTTGTFIKHPDATWSTGNSGIPTGWTVKNMNPQTQTIDYSKVTAAYGRGNVGLSAIYAKGNVLLWSKNA